jgi:hypothetical protein
MRRCTVRMGLLASALLLAAAPPSHLVGLIRPDEMPASAHAEGEPDEDEVPPG